MAIRSARFVQQLPAYSMARAESSLSTIGHITLGTKQTGAPSAGNPHAGCDVAGAGNGFTVWLLRHSQRKRGETARPDLRDTAPVLDPTGIATGISCFPARVAPMRCCLPCSRAPLGCRARCSPAFATSSMPACNRLSEKISCSAGNTSGNTRITHSTSAFSAILP